MTDLFNDSIPGDIYNFKYPVIKINDPIMSVLNVGVSVIITLDQKHVFCQKFKPKDVEYHHHHTEIWFSPNRCFSMEPPRALWISQTELDNSDGIVDVYRMNPRYFGRELEPSDIMIMQEVAQGIIDSKHPYSVGQLINILADTIAGYPNKNDFFLFTPLDKKPLVCSVAVASIIAKWRHVLLASQGEEIPQPFKILNPNAWSTNFQLDWLGHWDIRVTPPAIFACSDHFQNEYIRVGSYDHGKRIA